MDHEVHIHQEHWKESLHMQAIQAPFGLLGSRGRGLAIPLNRFFKIRWNAPPFLVLLPEKIHRRGIVPLLGHSKPFRGLNIVGMSIDPVRVNCAERGFSPRGSPVRRNDDTT